jgi:alkanesulfonate monooxygenase SsuD/methylene tetrahydromethanopterin reductase-like flavin-dependent oxidoreductase (luciferase family)
MKTPWFGFHMPLFTFPGASSAELFDRVVEQAQAAEANGFSLVTVMDHLYQIGGVGQVDEPMLEGWSVLNALARETRSVRLGTLVTGVTYRNPGLLAKMVTTLDITSAGRAILGLGAAWNDVEHEGYGNEFPRVGERMDRLDEALTIAKAMFTQAGRPSRASITGSMTR